MVIACSYCFLSVSFPSLKSQTGLEEQSGKEAMTASDTHSPTHTVGYKCMAATNIKHTKDFALF